MNYLKILLGILAMCLAWMVMYRTGLILRFNAWMREQVFSDSHVLFSGQRIAVLLLILGGVSLFSGLAQWVETQTVPPQIALAMLEQAKGDFRDRYFVRVIKRCKVLVRSDPKNVEAWELLIQSLWATGQKQQAAKAVEVLLRLNPKHPLRKLLSDSDLLRKHPKG